MKFKIKHSGVNILKIIRKLGKIVFFTILVFSIATEAKEAVNIHQLSIPKGCFTIFFSQKGVFQGETENYRGYLKKFSNNKWKIVYFTNPPFEVFADKYLITLGYRGEEKETFDRREYKNPILEILFHLNQLGKIFEIKPLGGNKYLLTPKGTLSEYIKKVILYTDAKGEPKRIEVFGGEDNYVIFQILKIEPACGGNKIEKP